MTSNLGAEQLLKQSSLGFGADDPDASYNGMKTKLMDVMKKTFKPEFLNRLDDTVVFRTLTKEEIIEIIDLEMHNVLKRLEEKNIKVKLSPKAKTFLFKKGFDQKYGARPVRRAIEQNIEDPMSEEILKGNIPENCNVTIRVKSGELVFDVK